MALKEELKQFSENSKREMSQLYEKVKQRPLTCLVCIIVIVTAVTSLVALPYWRVTQFGIADPKDLAEMENSYRATLAQILGGIAVGIGIYYTWQRNNIAQEGQITERFTRAVDQLGAVDKDGNPSIEIRLGGIYALERISQESDKDYWPIMEILTAYVRNNSPAELIQIEIDYDLMACRNYEIKKEKSEVYKLPLDIQAILTVIGRRKYSPYSGETEYLDLSKTDLSRSNLINAHLEEADLGETNFKAAILQYTNLEGAFLKDANLQGASLNEINLHKAILKRAKFQHAILTNVVLTNANLQKANLKNAFLLNANIESADFGHDDDFDPQFGGLSWASGATLENASLYGASLKKANLKGTNLKGAIFKEADLELANLEHADLEGANLKGAKNLTIEQLSKAKTLYNAKLDHELEKPLRENYPALFEKLKYEPLFPDEI